MKTPYNTIANQNPEGGRLIEAIEIKKSGICMGINQCNNIMLFPEGMSPIMTIYQHDAPVVAKMLLEANDMLFAIAAYENEDSDELLESEITKLADLKETLKGQESERYALMYDEVEEDFTLHDLEDLHRVAINSDDLVEIAGALLMMYQAIKKNAK